jgi:hypothetical protein
MPNSVSDTFDPRWARDTQEPIAPQTFNSRLVF